MDKIKPMDRTPPDPELKKIALNASEAILILSKATAELIGLVGTPVIVDEGSQGEDPNDPPF